jgi:hypothetical protein
VSSPDISTPEGGRPTITVRPLSAYKSEKDLPDWVPSATAQTAPSSAPVSAPQAAVRGAVDMASFGLTPAIQGLTEAGAAGKTPEEQAAIQPPGVASEAPGMEMSGEGIGRLLANHFGNHPDPEAQAAYERGRKAAEEDQKAAKEQHPAAFLAGQFAGGMLTPGFGAATAGTLPARLATGAIAGGIGGGLYGGGSAIGEGEDLATAGKKAATGALLGAPTGGILKGAIGPRVGQAAATQGERAAQTAADLGAPLPRGLASDSRAVQGMTAKLRSIPFAGDRITNKVDKTAEAAGEFVNQTASQMAGGATDRAASDVLIRPALQDVIDKNRAAIDHAYGSVRGQIDQNAKFTMPRTDATLNAIMKDRAAAGHVNPAQGLEQFRNVAGGATFNGAHRARVDAREAGNALVPNPGYNAADYNRLTRAMTADLRDMVQQGAVRKGGLRSNPQRALADFDKAEKQFGELAEQNKVLSKIINSKGEGAIATLLSAAKEKGGDVKLLAQLRTMMPQQDFEQIGGTLLHELGFNKASGEFRLSQFVTNWNSVSDRAKQVLFQPQHLQNINDIVNLGSHIKGSLVQSNSSHTASVLVLLDLAKDAALLGGDIMSGGIGMGTAVGAGSSAALGALTYWLGNSAKASSMAAWSRTYQGATQSPTPARIAAFKLATRNMANTLGLNPAKVTRQIESSVAGESQTGNSDVGKKGDKEK